MGTQSIATDSSTVLSLLVPVSLRGFCGMCPQDCWITRMALSVLRAPTVWVQASGSQLGMTLPPRGHLAMSEDILIVMTGKSMLLVSYRQRPRVLCILRYTRQPQHKALSGPKCHYAEAEEPQFNPQFKDLNLWCIFFSNDSLMELNDVP